MKNTTLSVKGALPCWDSKGSRIYLYATVSIDCDGGDPFAFKSLLSSPEKQAKDIVEEFYSYEQDGEFSSSWVLFHSSMKKKFTNGHYIQDRANVFMNHFGVDTFTYTLRKPEKLKSWKKSKEDTAIQDVYKIPVIQTFKGKYGILTLSRISL